MMLLQLPPPFVRLLTATAFLVLVPAASARRVCPAGCPAACTHSLHADGVEELNCNFPAGRLSLQVDPQDDYLHITCLNGHLQCPDELPQLFVLRNASLGKLKITNCRLRGALACWARAAGACSVRELVLDGPSGALAADHVAGLHGLLELGMIYAGTIPSEALASLSSVKSFYLRYANLTSPSPLKGLRSLERLELTDDHIDSLAEGAFQLEQLQDLVLHENNIENITEHTFIGLRALRTLDLSHNRLRALPARAFHQARRLEALCVGANSIQEVHTDAFHGLGRLEKIDASGNRVQMNLSPRCFSNLSSLQEIWLNNSKIASLPSDLFRNSTQVSSIALNGNLIQVLPSDLFRDQKSLTRLNLSENKIEQLAPNVFHGLGSLKELNLDDNLLSELNENLFEELYSLCALSVNNNRLRHIGGAAFSRAPLERLALADNQLSFQGVPEQTPFNVLHKSLKHLDLSGNNISRIFTDWKILLKRLELLNLSRNAIEGLAEADLQFVNKSIRVDLRNNRIARVILSDQSAEIVYPHILLDDNPFKCDCKNLNFFDYIKKIRKLDVGNASCVEPPHLSGVLVRNIDPRNLTCPLLDEECPAECSCHVRPRRQRLELTCSSLPRAWPDPAALPEYTLSGTELKLTSIPTHLAVPNHVGRLILSNLQLQELTPIPPPVHYIDLTNNNLTKIPVEILMRNIQLKLSGNPFICDCSHKDVVQMLKSNKKKILDHSSVTCSDRQTTPWQIDVPRLCSDQNMVIVTASAVVLIVILIAFVGCIYCRYSVHIKIILYSCDKLRWLIAEEDIDRDKKYDAFVSFSHKDQQFVALKLVPVLESGPRPLKLCVHYRDWVVGEWIPAQIVNSVEQSRRTIIVLSKSFVESVWGTMEFRVAYERAQEEKRTRIVVILLEDAPPEADLDAELRAYLSTNTYVRWGDPWFWEKLRYALAGGRVARQPKSGKAAKHTELNGHGLNMNCTGDYTQTAQLSISGISNQLRFNPGDTRV